MFGCSTAEPPVHPESLDDDQYAQNEMVGNASAVNESVAGTQQWQVKTSGVQVPEGWQPFAYDSNDQFDPFLLRRGTNDNWDGTQQWQVKTSGVQVPEGWEPFAFDSNDEQDPFLLRRRIK